MVTLSFPPFVLQVAREDWSGTLWANLNIEQLTEGIDGFMRSMRKFPKEVKALPICHVLEERMREFKDSIPLFADLKNDALRDRYMNMLNSFISCKGLLLNHNIIVHRHWEKLMELTGKNFDMNPDTFTLENLFTMDLHNYAEKISDIVASASKELSIEKSLSEVVSIWQVLKFSVHK